MRLEELDKNFASESLDGLNLCFVEVKRGCPFEVCGLPFWEQEGEFCRVPVGALPKLNEGIRGGLAWNTSGVKLRFRSDTRAMAIRVTLRGNSYLPHMAATGVSGFDLYMGKGTAQEFVGVARPALNTRDYSYVLFNWETSSRLAKRPQWDPLDQDGLREFTLNFPLYNGVEKVEVGLVPGSRIEPPAPFAVPEPILFYGSSITQGACATRPGNAYFQILGRRLHANIIGYGFSGNCRAEPEMLDVISSIPISVLVYDYDHNATSCEYLRKTHQPFFQEYRRRHPFTPVVFMTRPDTDRIPDDTEARRSIILKTYLDARAAGDNHVYFVDGRLFMGTYDRDISTTDGCHPTDVGFLHMADAVEHELRRALAERVPGTD